MLFVGNSDKIRGINPVANLTEAAKSIFKQEEGVRSS